MWAEAREIAKEAVGAMLIALWPTGNDWPAQRETRPQRRCSG
jgi:hypothetical protein